MGFDDRQKLTVIDAPSEAGDDEDDDDVENEGLEVFLDPKSLRPYLWDDTSKTWHYQRCDDHVEPDEFMDPISKEVWYWNSVNKYWAWARDRNPLVEESANTTSPCCALAGASAEPLQECHQTHRH